MESLQRVTVHGVEFRWPDLKQKLSLDSGVFFPMERKASKGTILCLCEMNDVIVTRYHAPISSFIHIYKPFIHKSIPTTLSDKLNILCPDPLKKLS